LQNTLNTANLPKTYAANISTVTLDKVNTLIADSTLSAVTDKWYNPTTKTWVAGAAPTTPPAGTAVPVGTVYQYQTSSPKSRAIQNAVDYANAQIKWANSFYNTTIPSMTTPV
jgi:hypothetical protein